MKFLHLGDLHIGKDLQDFSLLDDQRFILDKIREIITDKKVDCVLIAGDVYDRSIPSEAAVKVLNDFLCSLAKMKVRVCMISGNHDSDERLNFASPLLRSNGIYISSVFNGKLECETFEDEFGKVNVYMLPFVKSSEVASYYRDEEIDSYEAAVKTVINHADINTDERNICISHQFVVGSGSPEMAGSEGIEAKTVGTVEQISYRCYDKFDYTALGHIHAPQAVGRETVRYSGSILKYSKTEALNTKTVPLITLGEKGQVDIELVGLEPLRDIRLLEGELGILTKIENVKYPDDFVYVTLTDETEAANPMGTLRTVYPNVLQVVYRKDELGDVVLQQLTEDESERPFEELFNDFYRQFFNEDMTQKEKEIMNEAAKEAGIIS